MQPFDMAEKVRLLMDGNELQGFIQMDEITLLTGMIEVPEFEVIRLIENGIVKMPQIPCTFKITRNSPTFKILVNWRENHESHDLTKIRVDASGAEFGRTLFMNCSCIQYQEPAFDGAAVTFAQMKTIFLPYSVKVVK
jgi:hypothetical protein